jgi:hypothetical protein
VDAGDNQFRIQRQAIRRIKRRRAIGLGQVMPFHYRGRKEALFDIDLNIHLSVKVFKACLNQHKGNLVRALNAYEGRNNRSDINVHYQSEIFNNIYFYSEKE